jgi:hypothetical protein
MDQKKICFDQIMDGLSKPIFQTFWLLYEQVDQSLETEQEKRYTFCQSVGLIRQWDHDTIHSFFMQFSTRYPDVRKCFDLATTALNIDVEVFNQSVNNNMECKISVLFNEENFLHAIISKCCPLFIKYVDYFGYGRDTPTYELFRSTVITEMSSGDLVEGALRGFLEMTPIITTASAAVPVMNDESDDDESDDDDEEEDDEEEDEKDEKKHIRLDSESEDEDEDEDDDIQEKQHARHDDEEDDDTDDDDDDEEEDEPQQPPSYLENPTVMQRLQKLQAPPANHKQTLKKLHRLKSEHEKTENMYNMFLQDHPESAYHHLMKNQPNVYSNFSFAAPVPAPTPQVQQPMVQQQQQPQPDKKKKKKDSKKNKTKFQFPLYLK